MRIILLLFFLIFLLLYLYWNRDFCYEAWNSRMLKYFLFMSFFLCFYPSFFKNINTRGFWMYLMSLNILGQYVTLKYNPPPLSLCLWIIIIIIKYNIYRFNKVYIPIPGGRCAWQWDPMKAKITTARRILRDAMIMLEWKTIALKILTN